MPFCTSRPACLLARRQGMCDSFFQLYFHVYTYLYSYSLPKSLTMIDLPLVLRKPWPLESLASSASCLVKMIAKSPSPPPKRTKAFHLSHLDQNVVRVYTQTLSIFPVGDPRTPTPCLWPRSVLITLVTPVSKSE